MSRTLALAAARSPPLPISGLSLMAAAPKPVTLRLLTEQRTVRMTESEDYHIEEIYLLRLSRV